MREIRGRPPRADEQGDRLSRFLALVLRHKPDSIGVTLDPSGFVEMDTLATATAIYLARDIPPNFLNAPPETQS